MASETTTTQSQPLQLHDRVAIITGGAGGIGKAIALHLASLGAKLVVTDISISISTSNHLNLIVSEINSKFASARAISIKADVSDPVQVKALFDSAESAFNSPIHIVVNAAGIMDSSHSSIVNSSVEEFDRTFAVNMRGSYLVCKEAASRLKQGGGGRIVCVSSSLVVSLRPGYGPYAASKAAVEAMVKILAKELKGTRITVNCVAPGPVTTKMFFDGTSEAEVKILADMNPFGRVGVPEDVAPLVGFLVSDAGEWVNGQVVRVNGGYV